jgi:protein Xni
MIEPTPKGHLLLIDGLNVVRRVYEANPSEDSDGKAQGAIRSSLSTFRRILDEHNPSHVLAPFDFGGTTWRHALYQAYRQRRKPMPVFLRNALPLLFEKLKAIGVPTIQIVGVEADDVLATAFLRWNVHERGPATIISTDKDIAALVAEGAQVRDPFQNIWHDEAWSLKKFGVGTHQIHDLLALAGDSTDDIPGVRGVANKTAARLLTTYGSLQAVLDQADSVPGKLGENLRNSVELVHLARQLVSFKTDISLGLTWNALRYVKAS